jgi:hypothetical protein
MGRRSESVTALAQWQLLRSTIQLDNLYDRMCAARSNFTGRSLGWIGSFFKWGLLPLCVTPMTRSWIDPSSGGVWGLVTGVLLIGCFISGTLTNAINTFEVLRMPSLRGLVAARWLRSAPRLAWYGVWLTGLIGFMLAERQQTYSSIKYAPLYAGAFLTPFFLFALGAIGGFFVLQIRRGNTYFFVKCLAFGGAAYLLFSALKIYISALAGFSGFGNHASIGWMQRLLLSFSFTGFLIVFTVAMQPLQIFLLKNKDKPLEDNERDSDQSQESLPYRFNALRSRQGFDAFTCLKSHINLSKPAWFALFKSPLWRALIVSYLAGLRMTWMRARHAWPRWKRPFKLAALPVSFVIRGCPFPRLALLFALLTLTTNFSSRFYWLWTFLTLFFAGSHVSLTDTARLHLYGVSYRRQLFFNFKFFILAIALPLLAVISIPVFYNRTYYSVVVFLGLLLLRCGRTTFSNPRHSPRRRWVFGLSAATAVFLLVFRDIGAHIPYAFYWSFILIGAISLWRRLNYWTEERLLGFAAKHHPAHMDHLLRF